MYDTCDSLSRSFVTGSWLPMNSFENDKAYIYNMVNHLYQGYINVNKLQFVNCLTHINGLYFLSQLPAQSKPIPALMASFGKTNN